MMEINNLTIIKKKDNRTLIDNFNFILHKGDKVAIIGEEGNGKSTLIKAIYDRSLIEEYCNVKGTINTNNCKVGYLKQSLDEDSMNDEVMNFFLKDGLTGEIDFDMYNNIEKIYSLFSKLNINKNVLDDNRIIKTLSGGEKVKLQLVKLLLDDPDVLLLDEPSNDLDINTLLWLEDFIKESNKAIIFISHDEMLLENVSTHIIHLEQVNKKSVPRHTICKMNYADYVLNRELSINKQNQLASKEKKQFDEKMDRWRKIYQRVDHEQATISRQDPHGGYLLKKKMHSVKAQGKMLEKERENLTQKVDKEEAINMLFDYEVDLPKNKVLYNKELKPLKVGDRILCKDASLLIKASDHLVIIGNNGTGKTTLLKYIYNELKDSEYKVGYMPQNYEDVLEEDKSVIDYVCPSLDKELRTKALTFLGSNKFKEEEMIGNIENLSGGQKAKLLLIKLILDKSQILVLDEPTRNLSPLSNPVIRGILREYKGCIISVSHDRKYIDEVCNKIYELNQENLNVIFKDN